MPATSTQVQVAARRLRRQLGEIGAEFLDRRLALNISQEHVAAASRISRKHLGRIERAQVSDLTLDDVNRIAAVLGLQPSFRLYPDGAPVRDLASATRLKAFLAHARSPLTWRTEVGLPIVEGRVERRAWDAVLYRVHERCAVELEMRMRDVQALRRRIDLKRRDDPTAFLLLVADTRTNRGILAEFAELFEDLPRLRPQAVRAGLEAGKLPPTGLLLV